MLAQLLPVAGLLVFACWRMPSWWPVVLAGLLLGCLWWGCSSSHKQPSAWSLVSCCVVRAIIAQGLAKSIAWDGEGATCLMEVEVMGAKSDADARTAAKSVVGSSLVKSAIFGHDPNWGRIAAAAGYSGGLCTCTCSQLHC